MISRIRASVLRPGRLDPSSTFRADELVEKDEALGLFVVLLQMFAEATDDGRRVQQARGLRRGSQIH